MQVPELAELRKPHPEHALMRPAHVNRTGAAVDMRLQIAPGPVERVVVAMNVLCAASR